MSQDVVARYRRRFEYEADAHARVVRSLETVPADSRLIASWRIEP